uniref:Uncharacterized protein n=1 Tax=Anguilla anguilla TaxID=7936 RepID=A0A0E9WH73_ANGAN
MGDLQASLNIKKRTCTSDDTDFLDSCKFPSVITSTGLVWEHNDIKKEANELINKGLLDYKPLFIGHKPVITRNKWLLEYV